MGQQHGDFQTGISFLRRRGSAFHDWTNMPDELIVEAETLARLWDRAAHWTLPRISPSQLEILTVLRHRGQMNLSTLAGEFGAIPSSTSRLCDRLETAGLVRRDVPDSNRREVLISLTPEGRRRLGSFDEARRQDFSPVVELMASADRIALTEGLRAFNAAAQAAREDLAQGA